MIPIVAEVDRTGRELFALALPHLPQGAEYVRTTVSAVGDTDNCGSCVDVWFLATGLEGRINRCVHEYRVELRVLDAWPYVGRSADLAVACAEAQRLQREWP